MRVIPLKRSSFCVHPQLLCPQSRASLGLIVAIFLRQGSVQRAIVASSLSRECALIIRILSPSKRGWPGNLTVPVLQTILSQEREILPYRNQLLSCWETVLCAADCLWLELEGCLLQHLKGSWNRPWPWKEDAVFLKGRWGRQPCQASVFLAQSEHELKHTRRKLLKVSELPVMGKFLANFLEH